MFDWYEQRGQAENFIKELNRDIPAGGVSRCDGDGNGRFDARDLARRLRNANDGGCR